MNTQAMDKLEDTINDMWAVINEPLIVQRFRALITEITRTKAEVERLQTARHFSETDHLENEMGYVTTIKSLKADNRALREALDYAMAHHLSIAAMAEVVLISDPPRNAHGASEDTGGGG